ncbi:MAG: prepilin-type N-terminal cleavage/methylation domain-containing protein [Candidatus Portnoybacteria bacterium]|nr:prepilin-type N-terminal cleavage/methylation domain-containing protein [Candidatus Portnoybacteria bacterium]
MKKGFTLIELLIVVTIIGLLATIILVSLNTARMKARDIRRIADLRQVALALEFYYDDHPTTGYPGASGSNQWGDADSGMTKALQDNNYISSVPTDPSVNTYQYWVAPGNQSHVLKATLENSDNPALNDDTDGSVFGCDCNDPAYCIRI